MTVCIIVFYTYSIYNVTRFDEFYFCSFLKDMAACSVRNGQISVARRSKTSLLILASQTMQLEADTLDNSVEQYGRKDMEVDTALIYLPRRLAIIPFTRSAMTDAGCF